MFRTALMIAIGFGSMIACYIGLLLAVSPREEGDRLKGVGTLAALGFSWCVLSIALN